MVQPASILNTASQSTDTPIHADGDGRVKLAVGSKDVGLGPDAAWQGVASHAEGDTFQAGDGVAVAGVVDVSDEVHRMKGTDDGRAIVVVNPTGGSTTDGSATITSGGDAQDVFAANAARRYLLIQNLDPTEPLWIDFTSDAVEDLPSIEIGPKGAFVMEGSFVTSEKITTIAATTGHKFTAKEA